MNKQYFSERESKTIEFKENLPQNSQLIKTCVAFANGAGGEIIFGVEDKTNLIIGVSDEVRDKIYEDVPSMIMDSILPHIIPEIYEKNLKGKRIVILKIFPGPKPPYFIAKEGNKNGVYLRVGSTSQKATEEYIEELYRLQKKVYFDEEATEVSFDQLDKKLLKKTFGPTITTEKVLMEKLAIRNIQLPKKLMATNAALLYFHQNPENFIPEALIICTEFKGTKGREIIRSLTLTGPIPELVRSTLNTLTSWLERDLKLKKNGKLEGHQLVPQAAIREAIINAFVHRKYFIPGAIKVALYENRLEIFSPGGFPGLISLKNLGDGTTFLRNPTIAKIARKLKLIEKLGSGIKLMFDSCQKAQIKKPEFNEDGDFVKVTFSFERELNINKQLSDEENIIQIAKNLKFLKIKDLIKELGFSRNTATRKMNALVDKKIFKRQGSGAGVVFIFLLEDK